MKNQFSKLLTGALVTGILAGGVALAEDNATHSAQQPVASSDKNGCNQKKQDEMKEKNGCKGITKKDDKNSCAAKKQEKNACGGKNGCG